MKEGGEFLCNCLIWLHVLTEQRGWQCKRRRTVNLLNCILLSSATLTVDLASKSQEGAWRTPYKGSQYWFQLKTHSPKSQCSHPHAYCGRTD